ncbi:hypothetical protein BGZ97_003654 [Linnemannia gamsii]|uniref:Uncharacterized protein n=1 Tax=Linnemannia gamsii TaxID=64522 RepID=A0A9P6QVC6_9FUNG|nr:hypothetical protein BGZ97_003654 [Linnemannia gamsii]
MDPLSQLPLECLLPILEALVNSNNCAALAALLQTNRYLATVTLPYLYSDPYRFSTYKPFYDIRPDFNTRARDPLLTRIPTRALLNFLPPPTVLPMVLSLGIQPFDASVPNEPENSSSTTPLASATTISRLPGPLNYLAQIRHLHQQPWAIGLDQLWNSVVQLLEHAEATDFSKLEELDTTMLRHSLFVSGNDEGITSDAQETIFTKQHFILRRCRALRRLKMESLGNGNLRWAVDEKRLVEQNGQDTLLPAPFQTEVGNQQTTSNPEHGREGLVPLEEFEIETVYGRPTDDTDLAAIAFSQTLKIIKVYYHGTYGGGPNPTRHHVIKHLSSFVGRQWVHMPLLTHFSVSMGLAGLVIDPQLLLNIPNAISVLLSDETAVYLLEDIDTCLPAYLPSLKSLTLRGLPALSFHPDTLHSTDQLTELSVTAHKTFETHEPDDAFIRFDEGYQDDFAPSACYIPPADELYRSYGIRDESTTSSTPTTTIRPKWTRDWQLLCLVSLALSSEFAFLFQFRMLQGCPALKVLELETRTATTGPIKEIFLLERRWPTKEEKTDLKLVLDKEKYDAPKYKSLIECDTYIKEDVVATVRLTRAEHLLLREGASFQIGNTHLLRD